MGKKIQFKSFRFIFSSSEIRKEISLIENGEYDRKNNPLKNAPHSQHVFLTEKWMLPYSLQKAVFPVVSSSEEFSRQISARSFLLEIPFA